MLDPKNDAVIRVPGQLRVEIEEIIETIVRKHFNGEKIPAEILKELSRADCSRCANENMVHKKRGRTRRVCSKCEHIQFLVVSDDDSTELARNLSVVSVMALGVKLLADALDIHKKEAKNEQS
jgi:hypothetical protein